MRIFYWDTLFLRNNGINHTHIHNTPSAKVFLLLCFFSYIWWKFVVFISRLFVSFNFAQYCNHFGYTLGAHVTWTAKVPLSTEKRKINIKEDKKCRNVYVYIKESDCEKTPDATLSIPYFCYPNCPRIVRISLLCYLLARNAGKNPNRNTISKSASHTTDSTPTQQIPSRI